jgi:hypothetical protein
LYGLNKVAGLALFVSVYFKGREQGRPVDANVPAIGATALGNGGIAKRSACALPDFPIPSIVVAAIPLAPNPGKFPHMQANHERCSYLCCSGQSVDENELDVERAGEGLPSLRKAARFANQCNARITVHFKQMAGFDGGAPPAVAATICHSKAATIPGWHALVVKGAACPVANGASGANVTRMRV